MTDTHNKVPVRQFSIPIDHSGTLANVTISEPNLRADGLSLETWASSYILAKLLRNFRISFPKQHENSEEQDLIPILELGSGTGLVGISAQAAWNHPVVLTDLKPIVPGLQQNIDLNSSEDGEPFIIGARCGTLDWRKPTELTLYPHSTVYSSASIQAQVVLAADTVYSEEHPEMLTDVIASWLARNPDARLIIAYPMRVAYLDEIRELWSRLEGAGLESVEEGKETASALMFDDELLVEWSVWRWQKEKLTTIS